MILGFYSFHENICVFRPIGKYQIQKIGLVFLKLIIIVVNNNRNCKNFPHFK